MKRFVSLILAFVVHHAALASEHRVAILGDSITYGGHWATAVESALRETPAFAEAEIVNFGLASETVSGLSEPGHAGGKFPRPDLHERLGRILDAFKPTHVLACYGMNDGIYLPLDEARQRSFQDGMMRLKTEVENQGAKLVVITAPLFDGDYPATAPQGYDALLDAQAAWLLSQTDWQVIDIRPDLRNAVASAKKADPEFVYATDKIHPGPQGHDFIAASVARQLWPLWKLQGRPAIANEKALSILGKRHALLQHAWLKKTGHKRPGVPDGLPLKEAEAQAAKLLALYRADLKSAERPNILWITCEDISPYLGSYGCREARTPNLDKLAEQGIRFTRAYANAPVCGVARSTLLTGMYASTTGTHQMRCLTPLPASIPAYPKQLRQAGYHCTNNGKTDYNSSFEINKASLWDETSNKAHWKSRKPGQPFFAVFNITTTHESQLSADRIKHYVKAGEIPANPRIDPTSIKLPPYHPDLPEIRKDWARFHDLITRMDEQVGEKLQELEDAGVADNTIVFFFSDHGGMIARSKRYIYNVGTQVPLLIRFPEKWKHLAPAKPGDISDRLVSFVDFPKTILSLTKAEIPALMQGRVFLGENTEPAPVTVHFYRDRMGERPDFSRAVTDGRYHFNRHFMPHRPPGRDSRYGNTVQANWNAWETHFAQGKCDPIQSQFYQPKPVIELFDSDADPWQVTNLAADPAHRERIDSLSGDLDQWMIETRDIGLIPEHLVPDLIGPDKPHKTLYEYAQSDEYPVAELLEIAKEAARGDRGKTGQYIALLNHSHPVARYYGGYALFLTRNEDAKVKGALREMIATDPMPANRIIAAQALGHCGDPDTAYQTLRKEIADTRNGYVFFYALNALQYAHVDDRLGKADWISFRNKKFGKNQDPNGPQMALRIIEDAINLFPKRRKVD